MCERGLLSLHTTSNLCTKKVKMCTNAYIFALSYCIIAQNVVTLHREKRTETYLLINKNIRLCQKLKQK